MTKSTGFTLIELLIVVAIIAILAAIAVPNFLEAQTRAKVSRASSDLRTAAVGLESYYVDNNKYPYTESRGDTKWLLPAGFPAGVPDRAAGLTTPIAYLSSQLEDPFRHALEDFSSNPTGGIAPLYFEKAGFGYIDGVKFVNRPVPVPADAVGNGNIAGIGNSTAVTNENEQPRRYILWSVGPDISADVLDPNGAVLFNSRFHLHNRYDPTNGTVSVGNVVRYPGGISFP